MYEATLDGHAAVNTARERSSWRRLNLPDMDLAIEMHTSVAPLGSDWRTLDATADASLFQSWAWISAWSETAQRESGERPVIVIGRDGTGAIRMILPLSVHRMFGQPVLGWLGQSHSSYCLPIIDRALPFAPSPNELRGWLTEIALRSGAVAVHLAQQPVTWNGQPNVFAALPGLATANDSFQLTLDQDFDQQLARTFSPKTRASFRRKERRLDQLGTVVHQRAATAAERHALLDVFLREKRAQLRQAGAANAFERAEIERFYRSLGDRSAPSLEIEALHVGGDIAAVVLAMRHGKHLYMLNTVIADGAHRDASPGQLLLRRHIASAQADGLTLYDFGPGEARYKVDWDPSRLAVRSALFAVHPLGAPLVLANRGRIAAKRLVKRTPMLWDMAQRLRRKLAPRAH